MNCLGEQRIVFSVADVGYKVWSGRSGYLGVGEKGEEG
jgi:hypothetical protein